MFNVIKTRAAVSILEWVTSFFLHTPAEDYWEAGQLLA